ncbi:hypothetical protein ACH5RR_038926 [Cinchona calisaya]|uniref:General transcription factor 3C polypeptide 3 n=1 Tax=Cinchona calisaya TaxID=153742 RepID=A0ABD2Y2B8_9GENT
MDSKQLSNEDDIDRNYSGEEISAEEAETKEVDEEEDDDVNALDPLDFIEKGLSFDGTEDYEALAAKKRKGLQISSHDHPPVTSEIPNKKLRQENFTRAEIEEMMEVFNYGLRKKSKKCKKKGRPKGSKNKVNLEVNQKLGDATLHYARGNYAEAIRLLHEIIRLSPNMFDPFHTLGLIYDALGDKSRALNCYVLASSLMPKDSYIWKILVTRCLEQGKTGYVRHYLSKAIAADPKDVNLRILHASLYATVEEYQKAAELYEEVARLWPENIEALKSATVMYKKCDQRERSICMLEDYLQNHPVEVDWSIVDLLASNFMEGNEHTKALQCIEHAQHFYGTGNELPSCLTVKAGICHIHLGHLDEAEAILTVLQVQNVSDLGHLTIEAIEAMSKNGLYESALKYCMILEGNGDENNGYLYLKIGECFLNMKERGRAIDYFYKALPVLNKSIDARLTLSSLLLDEDRYEEAILVLCPPKDAEEAFDINFSEKNTPWWFDGKIKRKLAYIYKAKGLHEAFADIAYPLVRNSLLVLQKKVRVKRRLSRRTLLERAKVLEDGQNCNVFSGFRPVASKSDLLKACRARKLLQKKALLNEENKATTLAAGLDWESDTSEDESPCLKQHTPEVPPIPNILTDEEHHLLILDLCKQLVSLHRYLEALEIVTLSLKVAGNVMSHDKKEELQILGAQIAYISPIHGWACARYIVDQNPYSITAWNCYYKVLVRVLEQYPKQKMHNQFSKYDKFLRHMRVKHKDCIPALIISGHQHTSESRHQAAAEEYLKAYKLLPESPLNNLNVGTALINLALGHRIQKKLEAVVQGLAFLHNNLRICGNSQEALYNIARAYHHIGMVTLAVKYYEKVLAIHVKDYPIPEVPKETVAQKTGHCDLRREASYNLHLIYRNSGAFDLARQVLRDHFTV